MSVHPAPLVDRHNAIGILRVVLAVMVIYGHAYFLGGFGPDLLNRWSGNTIGLANFAVQGFFVLSGWLVTSSWRRRPHLAPFLWHRFIRLAPAFWICLAVTAFIFTPLLWWAEGAKAPFFSLEPSAFGYVWRNLAMPRNQISVGLFPNAGPWYGDWNGSLWTLFYEGACYIMVAVFGLAGLLTRWRRVGTALILGLLLLHAMWTALHPTWLPVMTGRLFDTPGKLLTLFFLGGVLWGAWPEITTRLLARPWLAAFSAAVLFLSWYYRVQVWLAPLVLPPALLWLAHRGPLANFEERVGGDYSYGIYLYGYPVEMIMSHFHVTQYGLTTYFLASLVVTLPFAIASWHGIERPVQRLKNLVRAG